ncbi:MAG: hypothetical protein Q9223_000372 [Gallowayella weberi]
MPGSILRQALIGLLYPAFAVLSTAKDVQSASACQKLADVLRKVTTLPSQNTYTALSTENWSQTAWAKPSCIVRPTKATEVQQVVQILINQNIPFAIRSGGHMPSPLGANINDGVLIDMSRFRGVEYDAANSVVKVGAGQRWKDVYQRLDTHNVTVVGGRVLDVGVGGLILGGGLSYLSDLHGLACDNVVSFEVLLPPKNKVAVLIHEKVVLANGSIVNANAKTNPDLWWALKGGGNNFGKRA